MTTSTSNASLETVATPDQRDLSPSRPEVQENKSQKAVQTIAGSFIFLIICTAIVLTALAYGTVHSWALAVFEIASAVIVIFWCVDTWRTGVLRLSGNKLQLPVLGLIVVGLIQLLPLVSPHVDVGALTESPVRSLSLDPYATRLIILQVFSLLIFFSATLAFTDSPARLRILFRTITIFGFSLAIFGLIQSFTSPTSVYWIRDLPQSTPFGPFINRHHFAGYMELTIALPLGVLLSGGIERDKRILFIFAAAVMGVALIMTNSRGGIISLVGELFFLTVFSGIGRGRTGDDTSRRRRAGSLAVRVLIGLGVVLVLFTGVVFLGGESALNRFVGTVNSSDPTTGRAHFWNVAVKVIEHNPLIGVGLGSFGAVYTNFDTRNGLLRLEQVHNDYLQSMTDAGLIGAALGIFFIVVLFRNGFARRNTEDPFRSGIALGALAGCFAVLIHSFFDFTLHTTSNALLFLTLAAMATLGRRVEMNQDAHRRRHRRRRSHREMGQPTLAVREPTGSLNSLKQ